MPRVERDQERENRIALAVTVDARDEIERAMAWFVYLDTSLRFPFRARCIEERGASPLQVGEEVEAIGMPPEINSTCDMLVQIRWHDRTFAVPLAQLEALDIQDKDMRQALDDWRYWVSRGYVF